MFVSQEGDKVDDDVPLIVIGFYAYKNHNTDARKTRITIIMLILKIANNDS